MTNVLIILLETPKKEHDLIRSWIYDRVAGLVRFGVDLDSLAWICLFNVWIGLHFAGFNLHVELYLYVLEWRANHLVKKLIEFLPQLRRKSLNLGIETGIVVRKLFS
ncbi:hypothetical protein SUGI_0046800 [Cryptomeria japonica]|nr:hypothetical protein SUGI_0046800 [Cryptomeria japonica]